MGLEDSASGPGQGQAAINKLQRGTNLQQMVTNLDQEGRDLRAKKGMVVLAAVIAVAVVAGSSAAIFLVVRGNDIQTVQDRASMRAEQTEKAFCSLLEQQSLIRDDPSDRKLADQAVILIRKFGCEGKDSLLP